MNKIIIAGSALTLVFAGAAWAGSSDEQMRDVAFFEEVSLHGSMNVDITVGAEQSVRVVADGKIIDKLQTVVTGSKLDIKLKKSGHWNTKKMHVYITVPRLVAATIHGSGDMDIEGDVVNDFAFTVHGSGNGEIESLKAGDLKLSVHGSGDLDVRGSCEQADISIHGSGNIRGKYLKCLDVDVDVHGSGDVAIGATHALSAAVFGSGDIDVYGKPDKVKSKIRGSGDLSVH